MRSEWKALIVAAFTLGLSGFMAQAQTTLISTGAVWKYLDDGSDQGTTWSGAGFNDTAWASGPAELGYGDGDEATVVSFGPDAENKFVTTYFRHTFSVANPAAISNLLMRVKRDDGVILYLNGTEVFRDNLPAGPVSHTTFALTAFDDESFLASNPAASLLVAGNNVIAAEIHQGNTNSSDISFDLELVANFTPEAPTVSITSPTSGATISAVNIPIQADASDTDGAVTNVSFFAGANKIGEDSTAPFQFTWSGVTPGNYTLTARATDSTGLSSTSAPVNITVAEPPSILIPFGSPDLPQNVWKYNDTGVDLGTAWREPDFDDAGWAMGRGQLGYGDGDEATILSFGPNSGNKYPTYYFRREFNVDDPAAYGSLPFRLWRDDGAVIYLNGIEVARINMPSGPIGFTTYALSAEDWTSPDSGVIPNPPLVAGRNVAAVEMHQGNAGSSDLSFDLELSGNTAPSVSISSPMDGQVFVGPTNITITATATDRDGTVALVEFFQNGIKIGEDAAAPFSVNWTNVGDAVYELTAVATDNTDGKSTSAPVTITVNDPNPPSLESALASTNQVILTFSKRVAAPSATTAGNYSVDQGINVSNASFGSSQNTVLLNVSTLTRGVTYTLTVNNVQDAQGRTIAPNSQIEFTVADFLPQDIGNPSTPGTLVAAGNGYALTGSGTDIDGSSDQFFFAYQAQIGDFDFKVRVASISLTDSWAKAGLMARETLSANSRHGAVLATPGSSGVFFRSRAVVGGPTATTGSFPVNYPHTWLRVRRQGDVLTGFASWDGQNWQQVGTVTLSGLPSAIYLGFAVTSQSSSTATAQFRDPMPVVGNPLGTVVFPREPLGPSSRRGPQVISEIHYNPKTGLNTEFIEIYNSQAWDEDISGYRISGAVDYVFPPNTTIKSSGFLVVARNPAVVEAHYGLGGVLGPWVGAVTNGLPNDGGLLRLRGRASEVIQEVRYGTTQPWPVAADGAGHSIVLARASIGEGNPKAWDASDVIGGSPGAHDPYVRDAISSIVINEFLAHTDPPDDDFIELYNNSSQSVDISGAYLSDDRDTNKFRIPNGTVLPARGFIHFTASQLGFALSSNGERIFLVNSNATRVIDAIDFGPTANGISTGRSPDGSKLLSELSSPTPGGPNSPLLLREIVINELMYNPITGNDDDEFVELYNRGTAPVNVGNWRLVDGINFTIPANTIVPSNGFLVIAKSLTNLLAKYPQLNAGNTVGDYGGVLANGGERVGLAMPDYNTVTNNGVVVTQANYIVVDEVSYEDGGRWGWWTDGGGSSLELKDPDSDNRLAANWADSDETAKSSWTTIESTAAIGETLGTSNTRLIIFNPGGVGESLIDDVEVMNFGGGNSVPNPGFENGLSGWALQGSHDFSRPSSEAFSGTSSLRMRAASRGDNGPNRVYSPVLSPSASGSAAAPVTVRCKARWLRGWPEVLMMLQGNGFEAGGRLNIPPNLGSPGLRNSMAVNNAGPALWDVMHNPPLPDAGTPVIITARAYDPDGIGAVELKYRNDTVSGGVTTLAMLDNGLNGDAVAGDGIYTATLPGQNLGVVFAFYVQAADSLGAVSTFPQHIFPTAPDTRVFPTDAVSRELVIRWGDRMIPGSFGNYHIWLTSGNRNRWTTRTPALNNAVMDGTFVYNNYRVIYNMFPQYAGSPWHRGQMNSGPDGSQRVDYDIEFPKDDRFLGVTDAVWNNPGNPGGGDTSDLSAQSEQTSYFIYKGLNLHYNYRRFVHVFVNGSHRSTTGNLPGNFIFEDSQQPNGDVVRMWFPDDDSGDLYKIEDEFWFPDNGFDFSGNDDADLVRREIPGTTDLQISAYRFAWRKRGLDPGDSQMDYKTFEDLVNVVSPSGASSGAIPNPAALDALVDMEQWMRIFAVRHAIGDWDGYSYDRGKNGYMYTPPNGRYHQMTWDIDFTMGVGGHNPPVLLDRSNDPRIREMWNIPPFRRAYFRAFQDMVDGVWDRSVLDPILNAKAQALTRNNANYNSGTLDTIKNYVTSTRNLLLSTLNGVAANFMVNGPMSITTNNNLIILTGTAPVKIKDIYVNGARYPVTWTSVTGWRLELAVPPGNSSHTLQGYDSQDQPLPGTIQVMVNYTGVAGSPEDSIVINEIMYNPQNPGAAFVEIYNRSANFSFDLAGWRVGGIDYTFPAGSIITNGQYLVLAKNGGAFGATFQGAPFFDEFDGALRNDGEIITLYRPGANPGEEIIVDRVRYEGVEPWPTTANGGGPSLQLIDATRDNSRVANWSDGSGWRRQTFTGIAGGTRLFLFLDGAGELSVDNISIVAGTVPEVGQNFVVNGDFESTFSPPWVAIGNHSQSSIAGAPVYEGDGSLRLRSTGIGSAGSTVYQDLVGINTANTYTLSFWYLPTTNANRLTVRLGSPFRPEFLVKPTLATPGEPNSASSSLPAFDPLWLNEVQPNRGGTGLMDNAGDRDPWVEIYNAGSSPITLDGYYLTANYSGNLTQWPFPAGTTINAGQYLLVWVDGEPGESVAGNMHANFSPNAGNGTVALVRLVAGEAQIVDYLTYAGVTAGKSYGDYPDGQPFERYIFNEPTPRASNVPQIVSVFINEWLASNTGTIVDPADADFDDWFELYNAGPVPVDLTGYHLSDSPGNPTKYVIPSGYSVPAGGFLLVWADEETGQNSTNRADLHVNFRLGAGGEMIGLYTPVGTVVDEVVFGMQEPDISQGRFPDGAMDIFSMPTPTPRQPNVLGGGGGPQIAVMNTGGGNIQMTFPTTPGKTYRILYKNALTDPVWQQLGNPMVASGSSMTVNDSIAANPQRFYVIEETD